MSKRDEVGAAARRNAEQLLSKGKQQEAERIETRDKVRKAEDAKIARLRALRLAKEAAEKAEKAAAKPRKR